MAPKFLEIISIGLDLTNKSPRSYLSLEFVPIAAFIQFFKAKKLFSKYDDAIATLLLGLGRLIVQVWEVGIYLKIISPGTIISSQTFLGKKSGNI